MQNYEEELVETEKSAESTELTLGTSKAIVVNEKAIEAKTSEKTMDINIVHQYSHQGEKLLRKSYKKLGVRLTGNLAACDSCLRSMAKAKGVSKTTDTISTAPVDRLFIDTSGPYPESIIGSKYWFALVDDFSRYR